MRIQLTGFIFASISNGLIDSCMGLMTGFCGIIDDVRLITGGVFVLKRNFDTNEKI